MGSDSDRPAVWSRYWAGGNLHSLAGSFAGNYEGEILEFWAACFRSLTPTQRVLDIGTGNGALPAIAWTTLGAAMSAFDAIDLADLQPHALCDAPGDVRAKVRFSSHVAAEALPFPDGSFDLAVSQFGFEYTGFDRSIPELARVLKPGGSLRLVTHHADSRLTAVAREEVAHIEHLLSEDGPMASASALYAYAALAGSGDRAQLASDPRANAARAQYNQAMQVLQARIDTGAVPDVLLESRQFIAGQVQALLSGALDEQEARERHRRYVGLLSDAAMRSAELCTHALTDEGTRHFVALLQAHGFNGVETALVHHRSMLLGWRISASA